MFTDPTDSPSCGDDYRTKNNNTKKGGYKVRSCSPSTCRVSVLGDTFFENDYETSLQASMDKVCPGVVRQNCAPDNTTPHERKLFELCRTGSVPCVQRFLTSRPKININAKSYDGETALRIAVKYGYECLVVYLSSLKSICLGDILMYAIRFKQYPIVKVFCESYDLDNACCSHNSDFPTWITPLSLAAEVGSYEIIDYLMNVRRHSPIPEPHPVKCRCPSFCQALKPGDKLEAAQCILHTYSAVSQPSYYIHVTSDPFSQSFKLHQRLLDASEFFIAQKPSYIRLAERVQQFAVDLIAECRNTKEVNVILGHSVEEKKKFWDKLQNNKLPTLSMALDHEQKCFVAQPNVQITLKEVWLGNFYSWRVMSSFDKSLRPISRFFVMPYIFYLLMFRPQTIKTRHYIVPVNRMITYVACYLFFLIFVFLANIRKRPKTRTAFSYTAPEFFIGLFVFTYSINLIRQAVSISPRRFFRNGWNLYDLSTLSAFWLALAFWISSHIHYFLLSCPMRSMERKYWNGLDPLLMADGFFVLGSVLAYLKLLYFFQVDWNFGTMKVGMEAMLKEFVKYCVFWLLIILSFTVALGKFYAYYSSMKYVDPDTGTTLKQEDSFVSFKSTFKTLFWGMFGLSSYSTADVVIENIQFKNATFLNQHDFTEFIGYFAFGSYMIMMGIIAMNLVIATMGGAFVRVLADVDKEWKFSNTQIYMYYMCQSVLPPPFNLLPHTHMLMNLYKKVKSSEGGLQCEKPIKGPSFEELVKKLILRYYRTKAELRRRKLVC